MNFRWQTAIQNHISALQAIQNIPDLQFKIDLLISFIIDAPNLFLTGVGKNKDLADKISKTFNSVSLRSYFIDPVNAVHGDLGLIRNGDYILATSKSGTTAELLAFFKAAKENRKWIKIFLLHCNPHFENNLVDENFYLPVLEEADHLNMIPTVSLVVMETILHSAACQIIEYQNFSLYDLYRNHPNGTIGQICQPNQLS